MLVCYICVVEAVINRPVVATGLMSVILQLLRQLQVSNKVAKEFW